MSDFIEYSDSIEARTVFGAEIRSGSLDSGYPFSGIAVPVLGDR